MISPTKKNDRLKMKKSKSARLKTAIAKRRPRPLAPEIYVKLPLDAAGKLYSRAHLRNKRGYLYLSWRDGEKVRTLYLGKRRKV